MSDIQTNPKCSVCKCYFKPVVKSSGQFYKCCNKCLEKSKISREENKCIHNKRKVYCKDCGGSQICEHNRRKDYCKDCEGSSICIHNKRKVYCKDCGGSLICIHNKRKVYCKDCGGSAICEHNRERNSCKDCGGSSICIHNRQRSICKDCGGSQICEHNRQRSICKDCGGSQICEHNRQRNNCKECNFKQYLVNIQRNQIYRCFKSSILDKKNHSIEYLGCDIETFINYFQKKIEYFNSFIATDEIMTFQNIHIDHIKPVSVFNLDDEEEFLDCCHYTNLQPLLAKDNMEKSNKWNETDETYWKDNIINKEYYEIYLTS